MFVSQKYLKMYNYHQLCKVRYTAKDYTNLIWKTVTWIPTKYANLFLSCPCAKCYLAMRIYDAISDVVITQNKMQHF